MGEHHCTEQSTESEGPTLSSSPGRIVRVLQVKDIPAAEVLREQAGFNQTVPDWERLLGWNPAGCFVAEQDGCLIATVTITPYAGELTWIGMMLVHESWRRQGVGRELFAHALRAAEEQSPRARIGLDATPSGQPLYRDFGFGVCYSLSKWDGTVRPTSSAVVGRKSRSAVRPLLARDMTGVIALDMRAAGVDRSAVLSGLAGARTSLCLVAERDGDLVGFAISRPGAVQHNIGPVVARDPESAADLMRALLGGLAGQPVALMIPDANERSTGVAEQHGLVSRRPLFRMIRGHSGSSRPSPMCWAIAGPELG